MADHREQERKECRCCGLDAEPGKDECEFCAGGHKGPRPAPATPPWERDGYQFTGPGVAISCAVGFNKETKRWEAESPEGYSGTGESRHDAALACFRSWLVAPDENRVSVDRDALEALVGGSVISFGPGEKVAAAVASLRAALDGKEKEGDGESPALRPDGCPTCGSRITIAERPPLVLHDKEGENR